MINSKFKNDVEEDNKDEVKNNKKMEGILYKDYQSISNKAKNIEFLINLVEDSYSYEKLGNSFIVFNSIYDILYLVYTNKKQSLISFNLNSRKKINEIKKSHNWFISNITHFKDNNNKRDLIITISYFDNNIKLWNINNMECLYNYEYINKSGYIFSACFLYDNNQIYIISSNWNFNNANIELIKIYNLEGNKIKEINNSDQNVNYIESYYDNKLLNNFIITGNIGYIKSYNYIENKVYHEYIDGNNRDEYHTNLIIDFKEDITELMESCDDGIVRIWNFHSGELINKINLFFKIFSICLWEYDQLYVSCDDNTIKLIDLKNKKIINNLINHSKFVVTIKKIIHSKYGECLISQGFGEDNIKLWTYRI